MRRLRKGPVLVLLALVAWASQAHGQDQPDQAQDERRARELFREGSALYEEGRYDEAIARFSAAYDLAPRPALLFNIAQAYRLKGPEFCATALRYYQRDLQDEPGASNRAELEELITQMDACARPPAPPPPAPRPPVTTLAASAPARTTRAPLIGAVVGGGVVAVGLGTYAAAYLKFRSVQDARYPRGTFRSWELVTDASYAMMALGAATAAVSLLLFDGGARPGDARVTLSLQGTGAGLQGRF